MNEAQLAKLLVDHLEATGYECYKEVSLRGKGGNIRSDAYFVRRNTAGIITETIAVETKTSFSLKVIHQAYLWRKAANQVFVGIPVMKRKDSKMRKFAIEICKSMGIGVYEIQPGTIKVLAKSAQCNSPVLPPLYEAQKDSAAGNDQSKFYTSFKHTINLLHAHMEEKVSVSLDDAIRAIPHHYKTHSSARSSLIGYINRGVIVGYLIESYDGVTYVVKKNI